MAAVVKNKLKAARDALGKKDYSSARDAATQVLDFEPQNYNAHVFLGLALLELGQLDQSEQEYRKAIDANPTQLLAWQGLSKFYERTEKWSEYTESLEKLMHLYAETNDASKCAETLQRFIDLRRERGTPLQLVDALSLYLPDSPLFGTLSLLPLPDPTNPTATSTFAAQSAVHDSLPVLEEMVSLTETEERETSQREFDKRRTRINAGPPEQLKKDIALEVMGNSKLPKLYDEVMSHPNTSDELRRSTESKLLRHRLEHLRAVPLGNALKAKLAAEIDSMLDGIILLGIPDELAWTIGLEGQNTDSIEGYDIAKLRTFIALFPTSRMAALLRAYLNLMAIPLSEEDSDDDHPKAEADGPDDAFDDVLDAFNDLPDSIIAHRILGELYDAESDHENAIKVAESGLELVRRAERDRGRKLTQVRKAFNVILGTSLVSFFPPKHHPRALGILDDVLAHDPDNVKCLMGRGYVLQQAGKWADAAALFARAALLSPGDDQGHRLRAREEEVWCRMQVGETDSVEAALGALVAELDALEGREADSARCWWRLGKCHEARDDFDEGYRCFITALKRSSDFAPAFTSLGIYYSERADPPDPNRASKCFQKAFELDPREAEAAHRLASGFANELEWDLVEVVARRTIEGEGGLEGGSAPAAPDRVAASRHLPKNIWAWKALGVVELTRRNHAPAIQAFQIALRATPEDQLLWVRLGEAYSKAGRYAAAVKALAHAQELKPDDWVCVYFMAEVQRQTGQFEEAITSLRSILASRPSDLIVAMALARTHLDLGQSERVLGFFARAEASFVAAVQAALGTIEGHSGFRGVAWKTIADALYQLSRSSTFDDEDGVRSAASDALALLSSHSSPRSPDCKTLHDLFCETPVAGTTVLQLAVVAYDYRLSLKSPEDGASGSAWADVGVALYASTAAKVDIADKEATLKQASGCITEALKRDGYNDNHWNTLGNINFSGQPKTAQHAYIKALEIDNKNVVTWTNLGLLYLHHSDLTLANEAFHRAQTLDPSYTLAWVGQGLVATANGHDADAAILFEHAMGLSADVPAADLEYATRVFAQLNRTPARIASPDSLIPAFFALSRYCKELPASASGLHLFALVCERVGHLELGAELAARAIALLEAAYEESEDSTIERQFVVASTTAARLRLALGAYEDALEAFQTALGLLGEVPEGAARDTVLLMVQCQFGAGLAQFKAGRLGEALALFEAALQTAGEDLTMRGQVTVLLAQTLWALGSGEARESAKAQLLQCIAADPENLTAINTLAGMGILTHDDGLVDAALSEILALPLERRHELDPRRDVTYLLTQHHLGQARFAIAQAAAFAEPAQPALRRQLATLTLQQGEAATALSVLRGASADDDLAEGGGDGLALRAVAKALADSSDPASLRLAQKAVQQRPWEMRNWRALAFTRSRAANG